MGGGGVQGVGWRGGNSGREKGKGGGLYVYIRYFFFPLYPLTPLPFSLSSLVPAPRTPTNTPNHPTHTQAHLVNQLFTSFTKRPLSWLRRRN
jgi:hypothetical protein